MTVDPNVVKSPIGKITRDKFVVITENPAYSVALFGWEEDEKGENTVVGVRWNGSADKAGYPTSPYGHPQWFVLPDIMAHPYIVSFVHSYEFKQLESGKRTLAAKLMESYLTKMNKQYIG